jgi:hypothetical protein
MIGGICRQAVREAAMNELLEQTAIKQEQQDEKRKGKLRRRHESNDMGFESIPYSSPTVGRIPSTFCSGVTRKLRSLCRPAADFSSNSGTE